MGSRRPLEGGNQMQSKQERLLEDDQLQVGVPLPRMFMEPQNLRSVPPVGPLSSLPWFQSDAALSAVLCCRCCEGVLCCGLIWGAGPW